MFPTCVFISILLSLWFGLHPMKKGVFTLCIYFLELRMTAERLLESASALFWSHSPVHRLIAVFQS